MKQIKQLKSLVERHGGVLEEDEAMPGFRLFQACAPYGKAWGCDNIRALVIHWQSGNSDQAYRLNEEAYADAEQRLSSGLVDKEDE